MPTVNNAEKAKRRRVVATGVVAGQKPRTIARAAGTTTRNVQRIAAEPETQFLVTQALKPQRKKLEQMATAAVRVVLEGFGAQKSVKTGKDVWEWHGDAIARLRAVERYGELLTLAQGKVQEAQAEETTQFTWEEITTLYRSRKLTSSQE
jgi:hypothetical protein